MSSSSSCGSSMRPSPVSPQAWSPEPTSRTCAPSAASCAMLRCVAGWAHISRFMAGASSSGTLSMGRARHIRLSSSSARPCSSLAMKSALHGAIRIASASRRQVDVRHVVGLARIPLRAIDRPVGQRLHRHRRDEMLRRLGHHHLHGGAFLDQGAAQFGRLVAGDAAGEAQDDMFASKIIHGAQCNSASVVTPAARTAMPRSRRTVRRLRVRLDARKARAERRYNLAFTTSRELSSRP